MMKKGGHNGEGGMHDIKKGHAANVVWVLLLEKIKLK